MTRPWLTLALSLVLMLGLGAGMLSLVQVNVDVRNHFGKDDPHIIALKELEDIYALSDAALLAVSPESGTIFNRQTLLAISELTDELWRVPYVTRVDSITNYLHSEGFEDELVVENLIGDPMSMSAEDFAKAEAIALNTSEIAGRFISRDGRVAGLVVTIALPATDRDNVKLEVTDRLNSIVTQARLDDPGIRFHITGELMLNRAMSDSLNDEMTILVPIALGIMLLVAIVLLRSLLGVVAIVVMLVAVTLSAVGFLGWTGMTFYGESAAAIFVLMAVTVAHSVHIIEGMFAGMRQGLDRVEAATRSMRSNMWPVFLTSLTTAIGFLSLNFAGMPPFKVLGNMVAFGAMAAFVFSVTLLPVFLCLVPIRMKEVKPDHVDMFDRIGQFIVLRRKALFWSSGVVIVAAIAGVPRLELQENWLELLTERYEFRQSADFISKNFTGVESLEYSLDSGLESGVTNVDYLEQVDAFSDWYREQPEVAHVFSIADIMKRLNQNLNGDNPEFYILPDDSDLAAQFLLLYEFSLPVGRDLNNLINVERSTSRVTVVLKSITTKEKVALDQRARGWFRANAPELDSAASGIAVVGAYSIQRNINGMLIGTAIAMGIVSLLLLVVFKSAKYGFVSLIPNFVPAAMALGLWGHFISEVGVAASVVTAIAFGIIVDDTIHLMTKYVRARREGKLPSESVLISVRTVGRALLVTTAVFALGFLVFAGSGSTGNQTLGILVGMTVVIALLADFLFLPPLLMALDKTQETSDEIRERLS